MLLMSFAGLFLGLAKLGGLVLFANPLMEQQPLHAPLKAAPDPHNFLPQPTQDQGPTKCLLHLGLPLAAITTSNTVPTLSLQSNKASKKNLWKIQCASGVVTQTAAIQPPELSHL
jgi:hypothetical protein